MSEIGSIAMKIAIVALVVKLVLLGLRVVIDEVIRVRIRRRRDRLIAELREYSDQVFKADVDEAGGDYIIGVAGDDDTILINPRRADYLL